MSDTRALALSESTGNIEYALQSHLHALASGECREEEFAQEIAALLRDAPNSTWHILAAILHRHLRGEISADVFRARASEIVGRELHSGTNSATIDLLDPADPKPALENAAPPPEPTGPIEIGRVLRGRYVLEKRLGSGGMGTVFKALDLYRSDLPEADRYVAVKILHEKTDRQAELLANLRREFYCTQRLSHRNIVKVYELDRDGEVDFFTMELLEGELLSSVTERLHPRPMPRAFAWKIIREIGAGLTHAHARNVVHTDLKPHNIMITHAGGVRILDFGASSTSTTQSPDALGRRNSAVTPAYACCELLAGRSADPRDDIYAFACLAYELLAGSHPFQRRPSTVARDLGIVPKRPPGLTRQQWKALEMGLSWHRAGRSISVRAWVNKFNAERAAASQLPRAREIEAAPASLQPAASLRAATLFAVFLITVAVWVSVIRMTPADKSRIHSASTAVSGLDLTDRGAQLSDAPGDAKTGAGAVAVDTVPRSAPGADIPPETPDTRVQLADTAKLADNAKRETVRQKPASPVSSPTAVSSPAAVSSPTAVSSPAAVLNPTLVSAANYRVRSGENFAEIRVHRSPRTRKDSFVWWTEAASAKPGIDYVHQGKVTQSFPKGKNSTSFFIKLVPTASRSESEVFYVAIAEAGPGAPSRPVERAAIWLPTTRDHS